MHMFNSKRMFHGRHKVSFRDVFRTQLNIYERAFFVKIVNG